VEASLMKINERSLFGKKKSRALRDGSARNFLGIAYKII
jgi:hypothetical protein